MNKNKTTIPKSLSEAIHLLDSLFPEEEKKFIMSNPVSAIIKYHHGAGQWIRNNWELWAEEDNNLKLWFKSLGIWHPDDMSGIILSAYWYWKNNKPFDLNKKVQSYKDYWAKYSHLI